MKLTTYKKSCGDKKNSGFTLVELLVSIALFSVVVLVVMGAVTVIINSSRKAQTMVSVINNLDFALESMTRTIKTGTDFSLDSAGKWVSVCDEYGYYTTYEYDDTNKRILMSREDAPNCSSSAPKTQMVVTAPEVKITGLSFYNFLTHQQPAVLMSVQGYMEITGSIHSDFNIQTTVAMRGLVIPSN